MTKKLKAYIPHVLECIAAYGPISISGIVFEVQTQHDEKARVWEVTTVVNHLIRSGKVELYDTGDSFVLCPK